MSENTFKYLLLYKYRLYLFGKVCNNFCFKFKRINRMSILFEFLQIMSKIELNLQIKPCRKQNVCSKTT
jgi:hypothetical protein